MNKKKFRFWLVFTILWLMIIFGHSAMPSSVSRQESLGVLSWLSKILPNLSHDTLRKLGHFGEFAVLGIFLTGCFWRSREFRFYKPLLGALVVAFLDETLQIFIAGRSGQITDIWIDLAGAFCGTLFMWIIFKIRGK